MKFKVTLLLMLLVISNSFSQTSASGQGIVADLTYLDVVLDGTNDISSTNYTFTALDVGKIIAIKKGYHNATDFAGSLEYTKPGRVVTATATIDFVTSPTTATIKFDGDYYAPTTTFSPTINQTGSRQAYIYTNNYNTIRNALTVSYGTGELNFDLNGVVGINPIYNRTNEDKCLIIDNGITDFIISSNSTSKLKLCTEDIGLAPGYLPGNEGNTNLNDSEHNLFTAANNATGNQGDITIQISCLPPDIAGTTWRQFFPSIFNANFIQKPLNINRDITLDGIGWNQEDEDLDGDGISSNFFWRSLYTGSGYGVANDNLPAADASQMQEVFINNTGKKMRSVTGIVSFSDGYNTNAVHVQDLDLHKISNFKNENGRNASDYSDEFQFPGQWRFYGLDFSYNGATNEMTILNNPDFSFYDYPDLVGGNGILGIVFSSDYGGLLPAVNVGLPASHREIVEIIDGHTVRLGTGTNDNAVPANLTNVDFEIYYLKEDAFGLQPEPFGRKAQKAEHAVYIHPNISIDFVNFDVTSWHQDGLVKFFSAGAGGGIQSNPPFYNTFDGCDFGTYSQGLEFNGFHGNFGNEVADYTTERDDIHYVFNNCKIRNATSFYVGTLEFQNTETVYPSVFTCNDMISNGGNIFGHVGLVHDSNDSNTFTSIGDTFHLNTPSIDFLEPDIYVLLDNTTFLTYDENESFAFIPEVRNGTLHIKDNVGGENITLGEHNWFCCSGPGSIGDRYSPFSENTNLIFERATFDGVVLQDNGNLNDSDYFLQNLASQTIPVPFLGMDIEIRDYLIIDDFKAQALPRPFFDKDSPYNGLFPINQQDNSASINPYLINFSLTPANKRPFHLGFSELRALFVNTSKSNAFNLSGDNHIINIINSEFRNHHGAQDNVNYFVNHPWANNAYVKNGDTFKVRFGSNVSTDPYRGTINGRTISNLVLRHIDRMPNEEVTFKVDSRQNRIIEVDSDILIHEIATVDLVDDLPSRRGLKNEKLFNAEDNSIVYQYIMNHEAFLPSMYYTVAPPQSQAITSAPSGEFIELFANPNDSSIPSHLSIGQEFMSEETLSSSTPTPEWEAFAFTLIADDNSEYNFSLAPSFNPRNQAPTSIHNRFQTTHTDYLKHWWTFIDNTGTIEASIQNKSGKIIFRNPLPFTLKTTDNIRIDNGMQIIEEYWEIMDNCSDETTWTASGWDNGTPDDTKEAIIDGDYIVGDNTGEQPEFEACSLTINEGASLTINANKTITVHNDVTNNNIDDIGNNEYAADKFIIRDDGSLVMVEDDGVVTGEITVEKNWAEHLLTGNPGADNDKYSIWSTPMIEANSQINNTFSNMAITYYWDTSILPNAFDQFGGSENLIPGKGFYLRQNDINDWPPIVSDPRRFKGQVNNGVIQTDIYYDSSPEGNNSHFFGNPYPSAIDWEQFYFDNINEIEGTVFFWKQENFSTAYGLLAPEWVSYNAIGAVPPTPPNDDIGYISTAQGFSVEAKSTTTGSVKFKNSQRVAANNTQFFRTVNTNDNRIWLNMFNDIFVSPQLLGFLPECSIAYNSYYDGKFINTASGIQFYSVLEDYKLAIQGRDELTVNSDSVPLGFKVTKEGDYTIEIDQEYISTDFNIILEDTLEATFIDLRAGNYVFSVAAAIEDNTRFILHFNYTDPTVIASFTSEKQCDSYGFDIDFTFTGGTEEATFTWDFGADAVPQTSTEENPMGIVFPEGNHDVTLTVSKNGTTDTITQTITVTDVGSVENNKVIVCHNGKPKIVKQNKLQKHLDHGDCIGVCGDYEVICYKGKTKIVKLNKLDKYLEKGATIGICNYNSALRMDNSIENDDYDRLETMLLYPNPTTNELNIKLNIDGDYNLLKVIDISGRIVMEMSIKEEHVLLNVSTLKKGMYFISVQNDDKPILIKKFIKN